MPRKAKVSSNQKIEELKAEIALMVAETKKKMEKGFAQATKFLFKEFPVLESFSWRQYTPYFNDGDVCNFSAQTDYPTINDEIDGTYSLEDKIKKSGNSAAINAALDVQIATLEDQKNKAVKAENYGVAEQAKRQLEQLKTQYVTDTDVEEAKQLIQAYEAVQETLSSFDNDMMKAMFGDHAEITVDREDGITVSEYRHD
jgi:RecG-like helicase